MVKNPPADAGDMGLTPDLQLLKPVLPGVRAPQWEAAAPQLESSPRLLQLEKAPAQPEINNII